MKPLALIQSYDSSLITKLFSARYYQQLLPVALSVSRIGDGWLYVLVGLLSWLSWLFMGWEQGYATALVLAFAVERPVYFFLKNSLKRDRPFHSLAIKNHVKPSDQFSFPSGHTSAAFLFATVTSSFFPVCLFPLLMLASLIGVSRVMLGVHYPTDILVGAFLGVVLAKMTLV